MNKIKIKLFCILLLLNTSFVQSNFATQPVISPTIPQKILFANQPISLERYDMRERYDREQIIITYNHSVTLLQIKRANRYFPIIEPILKKNGIPDDMKYLAVIESNLDPRALSGVQAAGLWQMMPKTAEQFGLEVNEEVDERYHIEKATEAACKYFKSAYNKYNNWTTVAASYNAGMGRISDELETQNVNESFDLLLNSETSRYVFRILAIKQFFENPSAFGFQLKAEDFYHQIKVNQITVNQSIGDWTTWLEPYGISYSQFKDFNIWLRDRKLTNKYKKEYIVRIPDRNDLEFDKSNIKIHNPAWITNEPQKTYFPYISF